LHNDIKIIGGRPDGSLLNEMRGVFDGSQRALLCVAFINRMGVALLDSELSRVGRAGRIMLTTVFGDTTKPALQALQKHGFKIKILNLSVGTYHPKIYISESTICKTAAIGSANLTSGLIKNVEALTVLRGSPTWQPIKDVTDLAEDLWLHDSAVSFQDFLSEAKEEILSDDLLFKVKSAIPLGSEILTISHSQPNKVVDINPAGILVQTKRSDAKKTGPQLIDAWMLQLAWDYIKSNGQLSNTMLCNELHVHRSAAVCAILAQLSEIEVTSTFPVVLKYKAM
jgi:HKD family nuclease